MECFAAIGLTTLNEDVQWDAECTLREVKQLA